MHGLREQSAAAEDSEQICVIEKTRDVRAQRKFQRLNERVQTTASKAIFSSLKGFS